MFLSLGKTTQSYLVYLHAMRGKIFKMQLDQTLKFIDFRLMSLRLSSIIYFLSCLLSMLHSIVVPLLRATKNCLCIAAVGIFWRTVSYHWQGLEGLILITVSILWNKKLPSFSQIIFRASDHESHRWPIANGFCSLSSVTITVS